MWKSLIEKMKGTNRRKGYTLTELLAVIGIIAVVCAIAITSIVVISRNLKFKQRNEYAKTIFMAAQANLSEMRSDGTLPTLQACVDSEHSVLDSSGAGLSGFPVKDWSDEYVYTTSAEATVYDIVLPVNSVEAVLRDQQVIIEYNPYTGNVYAVFYSEDTTASIFSQYKDSELPRDDESARKAMMLGYYDGSGLSSEELDLEETAAKVTFTNGEEGVVTVQVPMPTSYLGRYSEFMNGLKVTLTVTGETSGGVLEDIVIKTAGNALNCTPAADGRSVLVTYSLDSLVNYGSFANIAMVDGTTTDANGITVPATATHLTQVLSEDAFTILPGENVTIKAEVDFPDDGAVKISDGIISGVNPLFEYLEPGSVDGKYILAVSNGRNLQNLNVITPSVAACVETVVFTDDIYWNRTVSYYNDTYASGGTYSNTGEAPARCLPYFVPINNQNLFGSAYFSVAQTPVIQDSHDATAVSSTKIDPADHADISGEGHMVANLVIDATKYDAQTGCQTGTSGYKEYYLTTSYRTAGDVTAADTNYQHVDYYFAGLFAYVNTNINDLNVVNPIVKGYSYEGADISTATGALLGASGYNALSTNCGVYIDKTVEGYDASAMGGPYAYSASADQTWYGVSGQGSVGGFVGYAKSHRTASGDLTDDTSELAFSRCFAAVPVSGDMRGTASYGGVSRYYGYTNGVGGFIGNSELTNFYGCYASGDVMATGAYVTGATGTGTNTGFKPGGGGMHNNNQNGDNNSSSTTLNSILQFEGRNSMGAGGFVGTSHGTRYTNCFATGDVTSTAASGSSDSKAGVGGFVGIMCYDEGFDYKVTTGDISGKERIEQLTVFDSCYSVGQATINNSIQENFSGGNARIYSYSVTFYPDYYKLLAPYYKQYEKTPSYPSTTDTDSDAKNDAYYIYKDSYYLSQSQTDNSINVNSNQCASVASYDLLTKLYYYHSEDAWLTSRVAAIGQYTISVRTDWGTNTHKFVDYYSNIWSTLTDLYKNQLKEGFSATEWTSATMETTHAYGMRSGAYPFTMLANMEYYGDWPTRPLDGGIAYYEDYQPASGSTVRGFYFDTDSTSSLKNPDTMENYTLVSDGYAILAANTSDTVKVTVEGSSTTYTLSASGTFTPGNEYGSKMFAAFPLTKAVMDAASDAVSATNYYVKLVATITPKNSSTSATYTLYFNPDAAISHINPSSGTTAGDPGASIPELISISTARQLAALSSKSFYWGSDYHYVQDMDIDFNSYTASSYGTTDADTILTAMKAATSIGTDDTFFEGTYTGSNGYVDQSTIVLLDDDKTADHSLFGTIGGSGAVKNLLIEAEDVSISSETNAGIIAEVNYGTMENLDLTLEGTISVAASENAGLLAGLVGSISTTGSDGSAAGSVTGCDIAEGTDGATVTVEAVNAGGAVGSIAAETSVSSSTVVFSKTLNVNGTNAGGFAGSSAGTVKNLKVTLTGGIAAVTTDDNGQEIPATNVGGFAGSVSGGSVTTMAVTMHGTTSTAAAYVGGVAGVASDTAFASAKATISGTVSGDTAAGLAGKATKTTINNSGVTLSGTISGTTAAAGVAGEVSSSSTITATPIAISGSVTSDGTAAGYVAVLEGNAAASGVSLTGATISGKTEAAGFAGTVSGTVNNYCFVAGSGSITSDGAAAGFAMTVNGTVGAARVTPAASETVGAYQGNSNAKLTVNGTTAAAGFAMNVGSSGKISNSNALCSLVSTQTDTTLTTLSGFVGVNDGIIEGCIANVTLSGGYAFVCENNGSVQFSYGWYGDGAADKTSTAPDADSGKYISCYFVDLDIPEEDGTAVKTVDLFDADGAYSEVTPSDLADALDKLNGDGRRWSATGVQSAYPYSNNLENKKYLYPMLRAHCGDWVTTPQYAYGVIYYEQYSDQAGETSWVYHVKDLTNPADTIEEKSLTMTEVGLLDNNYTIIDAGYALFCKTGANPFNSGYKGDKLEDTSIADMINKQSGNEIGRYSVYKLKATGSLSVGGVPVVTWYADAIGAKDIYEIRTASQLANIGQITANFQQTHNIVIDNSEGSKAVNKFSTVATLSGTYDGNKCTITAASLNDSLIGTLSGTVTGMDVTVTAADPASDRFGIVASNLTGTIKDTAVSGTIKVTGGSDTIKVIGGMVGTSSGAISGGSSNVNINYTQAASDSAIIGGLVGMVGPESVVSVSEEEDVETAGEEASEAAAVSEEDAGVATAAEETVIPTIDTVSVSGSINLIESNTDENSEGDSNADETEARSYVVGGVIGYDGGASYAKIESTVTVDTEWAGSKTQATGSVTVQDPAEQGPVGMFVGYVTSGSFNTCSSTAANTAYQFLGEIEYTATALGDSGSATWFSHGTVEAGGSFDVTSSGLLESTASAKSFTSHSDEYCYNAYSATLNACTFVYAGTTYTQQISAKEYFYLGSEATVEGGYSKTEVTPTETTTTTKEFTQASVKYADLASGKTNGTVKTAYYVLYKNNYTELYVSVSESSSSWDREKEYTYKLYVLDGSDYKTVGKSNGYKVKDNKLNETIGEVEIYSLTYKSTTTWTITPDTYLITDSNVKYSFAGDSSGVKLTTNNSGNISNYSDLKLWDVDSNGYWKNGNDYLRLRSAFVGDSQKITIGSTSGGYTLYGNRFLTFSNGTFGLDQNSGSALRFFTLSPVADSFKCTFTYQKLSNSVCTALDANGAAWKAVTTLSEEEATEEATEEVTEAATTTE